MFHSACSSCLKQTEQIAFAIGYRGLHCYECLANIYHQVPRVQYAVPSKASSILPVPPRIAPSVKSLPASEMSLEPELDVPNRGDPEDQKIVHHSHITTGDKIVSQKIVVEKVFKIEPAKTTSHLEVETPTPSIFSVQQAPAVVAPPVPHVVQNFTPVVDGTPIPGVNIVVVPDEMARVERQMRFNARLIDNIPGHVDDDEYLRRSVEQVPFSSKWRDVRLPTCGAVELVSEWSESLQAESLIPGRHDFSGIRNDYLEMDQPEHLFDLLLSSYVLHTGRKLRDLPLKQATEAWEKILQKHPIPAIAFKLAFASWTGRINCRSAAFKMLTIHGPPMCAKSSLVREFLQKSKLKYQVVCPTRKLRDDWISKLQSDKRHVFSRHSVRPDSIDVLVIDEIFNFDPVELACHIRARCLPGRTLKVIALGDPYQNTGSKSCVTLDYLRSLGSCQLIMRTALGLPLDALHIYQSANRLPCDEYETTGPIEPSIFFVPPETVSPVVPDLQMKFYQEITGYTRTAMIDESKMVTVAQAQGSRARFSLICADTSARQLEWFSSVPGRPAVGFTRHTDAVWVLCPVKSYHWCVPPGVKLEPYSVLVQGSSSGYRDRVIVPFARDLLVREPKLQTARATRNVLAMDLSLGMVPLSSTVETEVREDFTPVPHLHTMNEIAGHIFSRVDDLAPETSRLDIDLPSSGLRKFRRPDLPETKVLRAGFVDVEGLAAVQSASDEHRSLRDMCDRQFSQSAPVRDFKRGMREGLKLYRRFSKCFYADRSKLWVDVDVTNHWLNSRLSSFVSRLQGSDALYESADSVTMESFRKSQSKVKPLPDYAASDPYGQQIIAASPAYTARFANACQLMQLNLPALMRNDMICDFGMSDDDLSRTIRQRGLQHIFDERHVQFDLSKQDSTHSLPTLFCFIQIAIDCGVSEELMMEYFHSCTMYYVRAQFSDLFAGVVSFNLGSGDPFTLIRNCVMMLTGIANTFETADRAQGVQKGDDWTGFMPNFTLHANATFSSMRRLNWKPSLTALGPAGTAPYHAGRFWLGHRFVADPVRVFYKHLTRLEDSNVGVDELYKSFLSRAIDYTQEEAQLLVTLVPTIYSDITPEDCEMIVSVVAAMYDRRFFSALISGLQSTKSRIIDTNDCIFDCVTYMRPELSYHVRASFRNLPLRTIKKKLDTLAIPYRVYTRFPQSLPLNVICLTATHAVVSHNDL
jgi:hypothetical protein